MPTGGKLWRLAYRFAGKERTLSLGGYPAVGISDARRASEAARATLARGVDPNAARREATAPAPVVVTFAMMAERFLEKKQQDGCAESTMKKLRWHIGKANPFLGDIPVAEITTPQVLAALEAVHSKGNRETARSLRTTIGGVIRHAIQRGDAKHDPMGSLKGALAAPIVTHRAAIIEPKALGGLLRAIDGFQGQFVTRACLQLMALLFPRPGELRAAHWSEFDFDNAVWTIPAARMKTRKAHATPLPTQAVAILRQLQAVTGRGALVFPGIRSANRPISDNTMNGALRRLGFASDDMTAHGFRSTASSLLNESGKWSPDAIERALAHKDSDAIRGIYSRGAFWDERVRMAQWWADELDRLRAA